MEAIPTKTVRYTGDHEVTMPTLGLVVQPGDEIEVDDNFVNAAFVEVPVRKSKRHEEES